MVAMLEGRMYGRGLGKSEQEQAEKSVSVD